MTGGAGRMVGIEMLAGTIRADMLGRLPRRNKMRRDGLSLVVAMMLDVRGANLVEDYHFRPPTRTRQRDGAHQ